VAGLMWYGGYAGPVTYQFSASQVSRLDYFHPSLAGQGALASLTWLALLVVDALTFLRRLPLSRSGLSEVVVADI
jgi:hypothetical protein